MCTYIHFLLHTGVQMKYVTSAGRPAREQGKMNLLYSIAHCRECSSLHIGKIHETVLSTRF